MGWSKGGALNIIEFSESKSSCCFIAYGVESGSPSCSDGFFPTAASEPPSRSGNPERVGRIQILSIAFLIPSQDRTRSLNDFGGIRGFRAVLCEGGELLASNSGE